MLYSNEFSIKSTGKSIIDNWVICWFNGSLKYGIRNPGEVSTMKTIEVPRGVKIACGKVIEEYEGACVVCSAGNPCDECKSWNDANKEKAD